MNQQNQSIINIQMQEADGYVIAALSEPLNLDNIEAFTTYIQNFIEEGNRRKILFDLSNLMNPGYRLRQKAIGLARTISGKTDRFALYAPQQKMLFIGKLFLMVSGIQNSKIFNNKEEAINWLKS